LVKMMHECVMNAMIREGQLFPCMDIWCMAGMAWHGVVWHGMVWYDELPPCSRAQTDSKSKKKQLKYKKGISIAIVT